MIMQKHLLSLCMGLALMSTQANAEEWMAQKKVRQPDPKEVGTRIVRKFIVTPHTRFGNPRAEKAPSYITYPDALTWLGALWFSKAADDMELKQQLAKRFEPLFTTEKNMRPRTVHVDYNVFGSVPLELYMQGLGDKNCLDLGLLYADTQWELPANATDEQKAYANQGYSWQTRIWIDDMFMITAVQSQAFLATGDRKYIDRAAAEMVMYLDKIQRPNGLFYHAPSAPFFWARGNGWMAAGMARLLSVLPTDSPHWPVIQQAYQKMMATLLACQDPDGMWHQLIDDPASYKETSGTAMFTYAMLVGVRHGWLKKKPYRQAALKGWSALVSYLNEEDEMTNVCEGTNIKNDKNHYLNRKRITGDLHAHAPLLWCAAELLSF